MKPLYILAQLMTLIFVIAVFLLSPTSVPTVSAQRQSGNPHFHRTVQGYKDRLAARPQGPNNNMVYHNGTVMRTVTTRVIFWTPPGYTIASSYFNLIDQYFQDIGGSSFYNINTQYSSNAGAIQNSSTFGGEWLDTVNPYPSGRGTIANPLLDSDIRDEVQRIVSQRGWPTGSSNMVFVFTGWGVESCADSNLQDCTPGVHPNSPNGYCAYHWSINNQIIYANMPYAETWTTQCRGFSQGPNFGTNTDVDTEISIVSHEHFEAVTDPYLDGNDATWPNGGWWECVGCGPTQSIGEIGDKCFNDYGGNYYSDGSNITLNGHPYIVQREWSNASFNATTVGCALSYPPNSPPPPTPTPTTPPSSGGIALVNVSSHNVQPGQVFYPSITVQVTSGHLDPTRGDLLDSIPESSANTLGAYPIQAVKSYVPVGGTYTFDVNNDSSFKMNAPNAPGQYHSVWQMRIGGNYVGPQAIINVTVQAPQSSNGVQICDGSNYGSPCQVFTYTSPSTCIYLGSLDNLANSIRFLGTYSGNYDAIVYGDSNCGVFNARYNVDTPDFGLQNNNFSSMRIEKHPWEINVNCGSDGVTLYSDANYNGTCLHANNPAYTQSLRDYGLNDSVSSIRIVGNWILYLWENDGRDGRMVAFTSSADNLGNFSFDNTASSAEAEPPGTCKQLYTFSSPYGSGSVGINTLKNCGNGYTAGTLVELSAIANANYAFSFWSGNLSSSSTTAGYQIYVDSDITANFIIPGNQPPPPPPAPISSAAFGTGADGDLTVSDTQYTDDVRTSLSSNSNAGQYMLDVASTQGFAVGNEVLIYQTQGQPAGMYEFKRIASIGAGTLNLQQQLANSYVANGNAHAQIIRVPNYRNLIIQNGGLLTAHAWGGTSGGIVAFRVAGTLTVQAGGAVDMTGKGYRGAPTNTTMYAGSQGEGHNGSGIQTTGANWEGGGGGCSLGYGNPPGGGGGGYGTSGQPGQSGNNNNCDAPGAGGGTSGLPELTQLFFGGGGGSGGAKTDNGGMPGGYGGSGGGVILAYASTAIINGSISVNGQMGGLGLGNNTSSNGGGGAGGAIKLIVGSGNLAVSNLVSAQFGTGGSYGGSNQDGGAGGYGRIRVEYCDNFAGQSTPQASLYRLTCILNVANDEFENALSVNTSIYGDFRQTLGATRAIDDPNLCRADGEGPGSATVWYRLVPNAAGILNVSTTGSNYDTVLGVFIGTRGQLTRLSCNDDTNGTPQSSVSLLVNADTVYYVEVADYNMPGEPNAKPGFVPTTTIGGVLDLALNFLPTVAFGNGSDGDVTVTSTSFTDDVRTALTANAASNTRSLNVASTIGFAPNQEVFIHQTQGIAVGTYEFGIIASLGSGTLVLQRDLLNAYVQGSNSAAQVVRVPNYHNLTIQNGGTLTAHVWDGSTGGIAALRVSGSLDVQNGGAIDLDGRGYRGAPTNTSGYGGSQGEGQNGQGIQSTSANGIAGGGGCSLGYGNPPGGGGGGHATPGTSGNPGNNSNCAVPGAGGGSYGNPDLSSHIFLGGGGGSGGAKDPSNGNFPGGYGGAGGGIIMLFANSLTANGTVSARGQAGGVSNGFNTAANGGGGAGGSILVRIGSGLAPTPLNASLGAGGAYCCDHTEDGGPGGDGRIHIEYCNSFSGTAIPSASTLQLTCNITPSLVANVYTTTIMTSGGSLYVDGNFQIVFPPNAVTSSSILTYTKLVSPTQPLPSGSFALQSFKLDARLLTGATVTQFLVPYSMTLRYTFAPFANRGILESKLNLAYWNGAAWVYGLPCIGCALNLATNTITLQLDHFTEFVILNDARQQKLFLPLAIR